ncbi:DUF3016 domain-containing protein [Luteimonas sp. RD2P54]|uniref:DUF3016 domain-containing protein n=1 Tax=Luteimonas endophytica TaxID=3042023 RepID=A0ABT6JDD7_9GAMM|nr:DUF3016 domain-containing protein [Luteimonas endophytica]MDH5824819.1 DUF3016 domain-containing protein [Luteimonas endophytica]
MRLILPALLIGLLFATAAEARVRSVTDPEAPRALADEGRVAVAWTDPAQFTEIRHSRNRWEAVRGDWVQQLAEHLRESAAARLPPGERLEITITDIRRAGSYEPWHGPRMDHVRMMRDIYWPKISLEFRRLDASGAVLAEGTRELSDPGYLSGASTLRDSDALRYEKSLLDRWVRREFEGPGSRAGAGTAHSGDRGNAPA